MNFLLNVDVSLPLTSTAIRRSFCIDVMRVKTQASSAPAVINNNGAVAPVTVKYPWVEVKDPKGSGLSYWWNTETHETTGLGSSRPAHWVAVRDPRAPQDAPAMIYWWNPETNQTTELGATRPSLYPDMSPPPVQPQPVGLLQSVTRFMALGLGISVATSLIASFFR